MQKNCKCPITPKEPTKPRCCNTGGQTVFVGSRFCTEPESRYSPVCGKASAAPWVVKQCGYFLGLLLATQTSPHVWTTNPSSKFYLPSTEPGNIPSAVLAAFMANPKPPSWTTRARAAANKQVQGFYQDFLIRVCHGHRS